MMRRLMKSIVRGAPLILALSLLGGCATYEYDLVKPERLAGHLPRPPRPQVYDSGPRIGFGLGIIGRARPYHNDAIYAAGYDEPRYHTVYDAGDNSYWTWEGETTARLLLTFAQGNKTFGEEFVFR